MKIRKVGAADRNAAKAQRSGARGFSLLEMLVRIGHNGHPRDARCAESLERRVDKSKITAAQAQVRSLKTSLDALRLDLGRFPSAEEGLALLVTPPSDPALRSSWLGPYIEGELPNDPWGNPYRYDPPQTDENGFTVRPKIYTYGADNEAGGTGMNGDIEV